MKKYSFLLTLLLLPCFFASADDTIVPFNKAPYQNKTQEIKKRPLIASTETIITNALFIGVIGGFLDYSWAHPTVQTIRWNFSHPAIWEDTDGFKVNQIGHPYQGSLYFNASRSNGYNFYEAMAFNALGSVSWEMVFESTSPSINDMITTTFASAPVGEMLHRLYLEADASGIPAPLSFLISPMDGINRLITGRAPEKASGNLYEFSFFAGAGYARTDFIEQANGNNLFSFRGMTGNIGIKTVYGNPFEQKSLSPYKHFELYALFGIDLGNYMDIRIISDGYLFSFSPLNTENEMLSAGLSLHFDFVSQGKFDIYDSTIDQTSNALDGTVKYQRFFQNGFVLRSKLHAGLTFFGVSGYYSPTTEDDNLKNYGGGTNIKVSLDIEKRDLGRLTLAVYQYFLWTFPETSALSSGTVFWLFTDIMYSKRITEHWSLGAAFSSALEHDYFTGFPNTQRWSTTIKTFAVWSL